MSPSQPFGSSGPYCLTPSVVLEGRSKSHGWISKYVLSVFAACGEPSGTRANVGNCLPVF